MKKTKLFISIVTFIIFLSSLALANGLNLNSLGSRALAMGGAFVGLADDFSAIFWNPAGIAQFSQQYFGFYGTGIMPSGKYKMDVPVPGVGTLTMVNAKSKSKTYLGGLAAYYYPINEKMVVGLGIYTPSGLGADWNGADFASISEGGTYKWMSFIRMVTFSPALAYKINDKFYVGGTLNINYGLMDIGMHAGTTEIPIPPYELDLGQYEESMKGHGYGATFGILVKPSPKVSFGATYRTASKIKFSGDASISNLSLLGFNDSSDLDREVTWPMWFGAGVAFKPLDNLTLTGDVQWTQWSKIDVMKTEFKDPYWAAMMAQSGDDLWNMYWDDATQVRFGAEYRLNPNLAIRGGFYIDPSPAPDRTMNVLLPNYDFNVITFGLGYSLNGLQLDFGFEYLMGKERNIPLEKTLMDPNWESAMPGIYNMNVAVPNISISYKF